MPALGRDTPEGSWDGRVPVEGRVLGEDGTRPALGREAPLDGSCEGRETLPLPLDGRVAGRETLPLPLDGRVAGRDTLPDEGRE